MPTTIEKSDFDGISDSSEEFFDCLEEFPAYIYLEDGLRSIQQQSKAFNYLYVSNIEELRGSLQIPPSSFPLVVGSPAVVIWVDVFTNTLTYFDPKGKLAAKHGIDLDHLKKVFFPCDGKVIQVRHKSGNDANLHAEQACLNFICKKLQKREIEFLETIPTLECTKIDAAPSFSPFGSLKQEETLSHRIQHVVNSQTILAGAAKKWDPERIRQGKLPAFLKIGGREVELQTPNGNAHACYFDVSRFQEELSKMGGEPVEVELSLKEPLLKKAQPIELSFSQDDYALGVMIPYHSDHASLYDNMEGLQDICAKQGLVILDRNLQPIQEPQGGLWSYFSRPMNPYAQDLILAKPYVIKKAKEEFRIVPTESFAPQLRLFAPEVNRVSAISFQGDVPAIQGLFEKLQIDKTNYRLVQLNGSLYLINSADEELFYSASLQSPDKLDRQTNRLKSKNLKDGGVVLLTMNQTSSYMQYSHEILTFLFQGASVMVYDNFQKGLSSGKNTEEGIYEAAEGAYRYLTDIENYADQKILAKGQCAGGPPTSQLGANHPQINVWIDQAPASYLQMMESLYKTYVAEGLKKIKSGILGAAWVQEKIVNSSLIPRIVAGIFPRFDVPCNLSKNRGAQLFTIGVPNEDNLGGDTLVPTEQQKQIMQAVSQNDKAKYVPLMGGEHITDWWRTPEISGITEFLKRHQIAPSPLL